MTATRTVAVLLCVVAAGMAFAPLASGGVAAGTEAPAPAVADSTPTVEAGTESTTNETESTTNETESPTRNGTNETESPTRNGTNATVATFMHATAAEADHTVEEGMFDAAYENATDERRPDVVADRTDAIERRLSALTAERAALRDAENLSPSEYEARMTRLTVEIESLEESIDRAEPRAAATGADTDRLERLRSNASKLDGPEVAETAGRLDGFDRPAMAGGSTAGENGRASGDPAANRSPPGTADDAVTPDSGDAKTNRTPPGRTDDAKRTPSGRSDESATDEARSDEAADADARSDESASGEAENDDANDGREAGGSADGPPAGSPGR